MIISNDQNINIYSSDDNIDNILSSNAKAVRVFIRPAQSQGML